MASSSIENINLKQLAERILDDVRRRGLRHGERYLTAAEASEQFDASPISLHRAMQLLADRGLLMRQRGSGTFVGPNFEPDALAPGPLRVVHVVMTMDYQRAARVRAEVLVSRLSTVMPEAVVEVHYVVRHDGMRHLQPLIDRIDRQEQITEGLVLIRSTRAMQLAVQQSRVPAVVFGSPYIGVESLPWLEVDQAATGRAMIRHAMRDGHDGALLLLMRDDWRQGDNALVGSILDEANELGIGAGRIQLLSIPHEEEHIRLELEGRLTAKSSIRGVLCRSQLYGQVATEVLGKLSTKARSKVSVVMGAWQPEEPVAFAYVRPRMSEEQQIETLGQMLAESAVRGRQHVESRLIPVETVEPCA